METWNRVKVTGVGEWWKEGEGTKQRTCVNDSWTWTMERELTVGRRCGLGRGGQKGKKLEQLKCNK